MKFSESLKKNKDFKFVYNKGKSIANKNLIVYILKNNLNKNRLGISVSKKVGNSIVRSRITRLIRESYRLNEEKFKIEIDIIVIARETSRNLSYKEIESSLLHLFKKHNLFVN